MDGHSDADAVMGREIEAEPYLYATNPMDAVVILIFPSASAQHSLERQGWVVHAFRSSDENFHNSQTTP